MAGSVAVAILSHEAAAKCACNAAACAAQVVEGAISYGAPFRVTITGRLSPSLHTSAALPKGEYQAGAWFFWCGPVLARQLYCRDLLATCAAACCAAPGRRRSRSILMVEYPRVVSTDTVKAQWFGLACTHEPIRHSSE